MLSGLVLVTLLSSFLWASYRQVKATLVAAGSSRASAAAEELAGRLGEALDRTMAATERLQRTPAVLAALREPNDRTRAAASAVLAPPSTPPGLRRAELWDGAGSLVLELADLRPDSLRGDSTLLQAFPPGTRPARPGVSDLKRAGDFAYFELLTEIRADTGSTGEPLGYFRRFGQLTSTGMSIKRLLGNDAIIRIGTPGTPVWTDFFTVVAPMTVGGEVHDYRAPDGQRWVGGVAAVEGAPWQVWVGYPRTLVLAPARAFLGRMLVVALVFVAISVALATLLAYRLTQPLHELATAAGKISGGDHTERIAVRRRDELGLLGRAFDTMADRVERAYDELRKSHEQTHLLLATAHIGVWELRLDTNRMTCSDSMRVVHAREADPLPQSRAAFLEQVHPEDRAALRRVLEGREADGDAIDLEYRAVAADGSIRWIEGRARLKRDDEQRVTSVLGASHDVTMRRQLESQLRQAQKMEAVGQLAGGVAHDFNNLLTVITSYSGMLLTELPSGDTVRDDVQQISQAADRAAILTRQLLAFSRQQVLEPRVLDVNAVVRNIEQMLRRLVREDVRLVTALAPGLGRVYADAGQLEQVIVNLAVNARDAMPDGGTLAIETAEVELGAEYARLHPEVRPGRYVMLAVSDTGSGMDAATQARVFEPFFTTKDLGRGTGLGLSTVYGIVKQSDGHISLDSEPGVGTTFRVYLPRTSVSGTSRMPGETHPAVRAGSETILLVEDDAQVGAAAHRILTRAGYTVLAATNGTDALRLCGQHDGAVDLLLTDMEMPDMSGRELAEQVRGLHPVVRTAFMSGYTEDGVLRQGTFEPGTVFIPKPFTPRTLTQKLREALDGGRTG